MKYQTPTGKIILLLDKSTDFLKSDKISSLNFIAKILISIPWYNWISIIRSLGINFNCWSIS